MVIDKTNAAGGINGKQIVLVQRDDQGDASVVAQKMTELKGEGCAVILGPFLGGNGPPAIQWALSNKVPLITYSDGTIEARVNQDQNKYLFFTNPVNTATDLAIYHGLVSQPIKVGIYTIGVDQLEAHFQDKIVWENMAKEHPEVKNLGSQWLGSNAMDFTSIISACLASKADVLDACLAGPPFVALVQQGLKFNLFNNIRIVSQYILSTEMTTPFGKDYPVGMQSIVWCPWYDTSNPAFATFNQDYMKASGGNYCGDKGYEFYLAAQSAIAGLKAAGGSTDPDAIVAGLESATIPTPTGQLTFDKYDHQLRIPQWLATGVYDSAFPIISGKIVESYGTSLYPSEQDIKALRAARK
jgi:branched-chain amino acid transport system substrate-binding protein